MTLRVSATGDSMLLHPFPEGYAWQAIARQMEGCQLRVTNLEEVVSDWDCHASTFCGGQWINARPECLDDLQRYGFNLYSCANNHSMDYSYGGLASTMRALRARGMRFAGVGDSLDEASAAAYLDVPGHGTAALISATSTFVDAARAGNSRDGIPARPGINPLRVKTSYRVDGGHFRALREVARATCINGERDNARRIGSLPPEAEGSFNFGGHFFKLSPDGSEGKDTACDPRDLDRIVAQVREARNRAGLVLVSVHSHQIRRTSYTEPDAFLEQFAHACIDAGADAVIGGGTHQLKPIEIYRGKPVFYSLGNFIFQSGMIPRLPDDYWDKYQFPRELGVAEAQARKTRGGTIGLETDEDNYLSVIPVMEFSDSRELLSLQLIPIELGFSRERAFKGLPVPAGGGTAARIMDHLRDISRPYGTAFAAAGGRIAVDAGGRP